MISLTAPKKFVVPERLDLAVKWRFFRYLHVGIDPDSERLYRWHIEKRTGGIEPHSWKQSVEDYVTSCESLLNDMLYNGFDITHPIEYGKNGKLMDGAHRLACSLLFGLRVWYIIKPINGTATWDEKWFVRHKISQEDLEKIKATWIRLKQL